MLRSNLNPLVDDSDADVVLKGVVRVEHLSNPSDYVKDVLSRVKPGTSSYCTVQCQSYIVTHHAEYISKTYGIENFSVDDHVDFLEQCAKKSGKLLKKGEPDIETVRSK